MLPTLAPGDWVGLKFELSGIANNSILKGDLAPRRIVFPKAPQPL
jgi:hypothetical protein